MRFPPPHGPSLVIGKVLIALLNCDRQPICPNHVASIAKGFSRALSHELQHSWKQTRARGSRPIVGQMLRVSHKKTRHPARVEGNSAPVHDFQLFPLACGRFEKIGGGVSESFRPQLRRLHTGRSRGE
ncbi:hypothetical protein [Bradyrhizobium sp. S3.2.12]|uniref:hypothetical protein n=1 Tax=Bradyrhizobium sp. S3.2.12 TaxID=3156387 RepID=UPI0033962E0A